MEFLKARVEKDLGLPVYKPANGEKISIPTPSYSTIAIPEKLYTKALMLDPNPHKRNCPLEFALVKEDDGTLTVTDVDSQIEDTLNSVTFSENVKVDSIDWPGFTKKLKMLDPTLEVKEDGLDLFDSTVLLTHAENQINELEVIFDLSRESTLPKIYELIGARKEEDDS
uniref:Uncharacterized protein n=1 Tax=Panagrolaimus sp. ES5 TaxID=591445 RepID=A0AC34FXX6_9BILA